MNTDSTKTIQDSNHDNVHRSQNARVGLRRHLAAKVARRLAAVFVFWSCLLLWPSLLSASDPAQDSASVLAQILAQKGTISSDELHQILAASPQDRVSMLTSILRDK